ncbi:unnamed protein product [Brassica rapa]|uniref:Uncharacterized protein n=1 Tax=Brassica campestris TaxID=3711 RepID=A0A8D9HD85_BRACM|nr:unnamed protein product [Brassica rapa]
MTTAVSSARFEKPLCSFEFVRGPERFLLLASITRSSSRSWYGHFINPMCVARSSTCDDSELERTVLSPRACAGMLMELLLWMWRWSTLKWFFESVELPNVRFPSSCSPDDGREVRDENGYSRGSDARIFPEGRDVLWFCSLETTECERRDNE